MSSETKKQPINGSGSGGFRAKLNYYLHSGEKKHVAAGIAIIGVILGLPWYLTARVFDRAIRFALSRAALELTIQQHNILWRLTDQIQRLASSSQHNRGLFEPDGPGTGIVKHKGGSKSLEDIAQELAAAKGVPVSSVIYDSFRALHVKKDGTYTDKKSERIDVEVQEIAAEMGQSNPDTPVDMNKIYLDVLGGGLDKKQRLFGTGSLASTLKTNISGESSTSAMSDIDKEQYATRLGDVEEQLQEERERTSRLEEQVKVAMEIIKQLQGQSSSATSHPNPPSHVP